METMNKKNIPALLLLVLGLGGASARCWPAASPEQAVSPTVELEKFLREAAVVDVKKDVSAGRSRPWVVTLARGPVRHRALFKHFDYRRPQPGPHSYKYELAAYTLARLLA